MPQDIWSYLPSFGSSSKPAVHSQRQPVAESSATATKRAEIDTASLTPVTPIAPSSHQSPSSEAIASDTSTPGASGATNRYERILRDEERYQAKQYPSFEEVPGCMQLFDEFMMCYALVPQLRSFYRRGDFHDCTWKFRDFKYCLSLKSEPEDRRVELWTKRRAEWWAGRRYEGSSEDVWDVREEPPADFPPVISDDEPVPDQADPKVVS